MVINFTPEDEARVAWGRRRFQHLRNRVPKEHANEGVRLQRRLMRYGRKRFGIQQPNSIPKSICHQLSNDIHGHRKVLGAVVSQLKVHYRRYLREMTLPAFRRYCNTLEVNHIDDAGFHWRVVQAASDVFRVMIIDIGSSSEYARYVTVPFEGTFKRDIMVSSTPGGMDSLVQD